jgi:hypothetical protein
MAKCSVGFISKSGLMGVWSIEITERHGGGPGCGRMDWVAGVKLFLKVLRAAIPKEVVTIASGSCRRGAVYLPQYFP